MCHTVSASSAAMPKRGLRSYDVCVTIYSNLTRLLLHEQQHSHLGLGSVGVASFSVMRGRHPVYPVFNCLRNVARHAYY